MRVPAGTVPEKTSEPRARDAINPQHPDEARARECREPPHGLVNPGVAWKTPHQRLQPQRKYPTIADVGRSKKQPASRAAPNHWSEAGRARPERAGQPPRDRCWRVRPRAGRGTNTRPPNTTAPRGVRGGAVVRPPQRETPPPATDRAKNYRRARERIFRILSTCANRRAGD